MKVYIYIAVLALVSLTACQKVITLDLDNIAPTTVIEANITDKPGTKKIIVSKSTTYFDILPQQFVAGASVVITDSKGNVFNFNEDSVGKYINNSLVAESGVIYYLTVTSEGKTYTSSCKLPASVNIDSISYMPRATGGFGGNHGNDEYSVFCNYRDPLGQGNYYMFKIVVKRKDPLQNFNGQGNDEYLLFDDRFTDGNSVNYFLRGGFAEVGDTAFVELRTIDKSIYDYFTVMNIILDQGREDASPTNPPTNISGGALGYFSVYSVKEAKKAIK